MKSKRQLIWILVGSVQGGGTQAVALRTFNDYIRLGYKVKLIAFREKDNKIHDDVVSFGASSSLNAIPKIYHLWYKQKPSHIICFNLEMSMGLLPLLATNTVLITRVMNTLSKRKNDKRLRLKDRLFTRLYLSSLPLFNKIIVQCDCMMEDLVRMNRRIKPHKLLRIYNPLPRKANNKNCQSQEAQINILAISRLEAHKNLIFILKIVESMRNKGLNVRLDIYGSGEQREILLNQIESLGLHSIVYLKGYVNYSDIVFADYDVFTLTSFYEGFPNALIEAIANNVPAIAKDISCGPKEIIVNYKNGVLLETWEVADWINAILWVSQNLKGQNLLLPLSLADKNRRRGLQTLLDG